MTALGDTKTYLTTTVSSAYGDEVLLQVLETETSDQNNRLRAKYRLTDLEDWPEHEAPLREAVMRRVARNLALRKIPLGISESDMIAMRVAGKDTEINRLEAPYRKLSVG